MNSRLFIYLPAWSFAGITACLIAFGIWQTERIDKRLADVRLPAAVAPDLGCMIDKQPALVLVEKNGNYNFVYRDSYHHRQWQYTFRPSPDSTRETDYLKYGRYIFTPTGTFPALPSPELQISSSPMDIECTC